MSDNIHFISAGAGSGKTFSLTEKLEELLSRGGIRPAGVIATTFTRLAAGELQERVRQKLIKAGQLNTANQMEQALIGTVNGVCGELLQRFAFEAGLPPEQTVLEEKQADLLFFQALEQALADNKALVREMNAVCHRLQIVDTRKKTLLWRQEVKQIVDAARANNQGPEEIRELGKASADALLAHFPTPSTRDLTKELLEAVSIALNGIDRDVDETKGTFNYYTFIRGIQAALLKNTMTWAEWIKCAKSAPGKKSAHFAEAIQTIASDYERHPQLRADIRAFTEQAFRIAADSLTTYQALKARKGLIDFVDQEQQLYALLDNPAVAETLQDELQLLMVDEFQDTSPIQLALFLKLARLADQVIWVGDIKQSIYGFRGADPTLMAAVVDKVTADGREPEVLPHSWRSRPELVDYVNALFVPAFANTLQARQVKLAPARKNVLSDPAVECWHLLGSNKAKRANALAQGIRQLMAANRQVVDKITEAPRPLAHGDIAILCRTHVNLAEIATALAANNLPIRYKRAGLLATPEGCLALACLRRLIDPQDSLATAEIRALTDCDNPEAWIEDRLRYLNQEGARSRDWLTDREGPIAALEAQRHRLPFLTPVEALRIAMDAAEVRKSAYRWGPTLQRAQHRLNNLSMLVTHAEDYINQCLAQNEPATAAGLVLWLYALNDAEQDLQATGGDEDAIELVTHHGAKGLEWPIVIAMDMDAKLKPRMWGLTVTPSQDPIDLAAPLKNRTLRYWPRFQGAQRADIPLVEQIEASEAGQQAMALETEEAKRLLYVSLTRARDGLIVAMNKEDTSGEWMDVLGAQWMLPGEEQLTLPSGDTIPAQHWALEGQPPESTAEIFQPQWLATTQANESKLPLFLSPSSAEPIPDAKVGDVIETGGALNITGDYSPTQLGSALHAVIATYINGNKEPASIQRILESHGMENNITAEEAGNCAEQLVKALEATYGTNTYATEVPICYTNDNGQSILGWIDLLVEAGDGVVVVDHKVSGSSDLQAVAISYSGQLASYQQGFPVASRHESIQGIIHLTTQAKAIQVNRLPIREEHD